MKDGKRIAKFQRISQENVMSPNNNGDEGEEGNITAELLKQWKVHQTGAMNRLKPAAKYLLSVLPFTRVDYLIIFR